MTDDPLALLRSASEECFAGFRQLRDSAKAAGPIDAKAQELILVAAFATAGSEGGVKNHARRARAAGHDTAAIDQAILLTLGATTTMPQATAALAWVRQALESA